jgi:hypothetical protein
MDCFPSYTSEAQKDKIRSQLSNAVLKFKELPIEEQNLFQSEDKVERIKKEDVVQDKVEKNGIVISAVISTSNYLVKSKAQEKRDKLNEKEDKEAELLAEQAKLVIIKRPYNEELEYIEELNPYCYKIKMGFVDGMRSEGLIFVSQKLMKQVLQELQDFSESGHGGFIPAVCFFLSKRFLLFSSFFFLQ